MPSLVYKARNTACFRPMANCCSSYANGKHTRLQQSHHVLLVPFTFLSAGSDTVTSLCRVLFHLSLMVLVCYWSRTCVQLSMRFTTPSCTSPKEHDSWKMHRVLRTTNVTQDFNLYQCSFPRACCCASVGCTSQSHNSDPCDLISKIESALLHSPLLRRSL